MIGKSLSVYFDFLLVCLKSLLNFLQYCFCFMFCFGGHETCGILAPWPGIKPAPDALEGEVLTTGLPGKSLGADSFLPGIWIIRSEATKNFSLGGRSATDCQGVLRKAVPDSVGSKEQRESNGPQVRSEAAFCVLLGLGLFTSPDGFGSTSLGWDAQWCHLSGNSVPRL